MNSHSMTLPVRSGMAHQVDGELFAPAPSLVAERHEFARAATVATGKCRM
jgi:hypothetical protein